MESKPKNLGRAYLVGKLQARGLSRRRSVLIVNVILSRMIDALKRGREVEFPFGKLKR
jgi:nucleoid DNA-binding protein